MSSEFLEHDPPIGTGGGGSFYIELPEDYIQIPSSASGETHVYGEKYNRYDFDDNDYTGIAGLSVIKEAVNADVEIDEISITETNAAALNLWLTGNTSSVPDVIIRGASGGAILSRTELVEATSGDAPPKSSRKRYYTEDSNDDGVTLIKWQAVNGSSLSVLNEDEDADNFFLYVYFHSAQD